MRIFLALVSMSLASGCAYPSYDFLGSDADGVPLTPIGATPTRSTVFSDGDVGVGDASDTDSGADDGVDAVTTQIDASSVDAPPLGTALVIVAPATGLLLDVADGASVPSMRPRDGTPSQRWKLVGAPDGSASIEHVSDALCVDVPASSLAQGKALELYGCTGTANQRWRLLPLGELFVLQNVNSTLCLIDTNPTTEQGDCASATHWSFAAAP
jgi:hypothetical protein